MKTLFLENDGKKIENIIAIVIVSICAMLFCFYVDFYLTVSQGITFLDCLFSGKVGSFYSITAEYSLRGIYGEWYQGTLLGGANYSIITYAAIGLLCLPIYIVAKIASIQMPFIIYEFWLKIFYIIGAWVVAKIVRNIAKEMGANDDEQRVAYISTLLSPYLLFCSVMISHFDYFSLLFVSLGVLALVRKQMKRTILFFMIAIAFKPFCLIVIVPMIVSYEKNILKIVIDFIICCLGFLQGYIYGHIDPGYNVTKNFMNDFYCFVDRFFADGFVNEANAVGKIRASYFIVAFIVITAVAYYKKFSLKQFLFFPFAAQCALALFVIWHPNWLLLFIPFLPILITFLRRKDVVILVSAIGTMAFFVVSAYGWPGAYDNVMIVTGPIGFIYDFLINNENYFTYKFSAFLEPVPRDIAWSIFFACTMIMLLFIGAEYFRDSSEGKEEYVYDKKQKAIIWSQVLPIVLFIIMAFALLS